MKKIILIYGGPSGEHEVSLKSAEMMALNMDSSKYVLQRALVHRDGNWEFNEDGSKLGLSKAITHLLDEHFDAAVIAIHGQFGEDGQLQTILESISLPYTGSGVAASALAMDKSLSNKLYASGGFSVPVFQIVKSQNDIIDVPFPLIIKPTRGGSSVGMKVVEDKASLPSAIEEALKYDQTVIVQQYIKGRELTCGVLEKDRKPFVLPPTEIIPNSGFFDYEAKYTPGASKEITPAELTPAQTAEVQSLALKAHELLRCSGISRSDFILREDVWYILETNTIPGMTETSLVPQEAKAAGIDFPAMMDMLIESAFNK